MFRYALLGMVSAAVLMAMPIASKTAEAKSYELRYADIGPPRGPRAAALKWWAAELDKRSNGEITIRFFWGQSLVKGKETMKAVSSGLAEMGSVLGIYTPAEFPVWNYANQPFAIGDVWVGMRTWHELRQTQSLLRDETSKRNVKILFNNTTGPVQLLSTKSPMTSIADLKGKKIRTSGGWTHLFKALGAVPVKIGFGELYAALDRGTIDATINYTPFVKSYKHYEVASHLTEANMGQVLGYGGGINLKVFNGMSQKQQDIMVQTSDEYMDIYARKSLAYSKQAKAEMIAGIDGKKVQFHQLSDAERAKWAAAAGSFTSDWLAKMKKKGIDGKAFIMAFEQTRAKYRAILKAKGYPWTHTN